MRSYTIKITEEDGKVNMSRINEGFNIIELIGFIGMIKYDLLNQAQGLAGEKVETITKQAIQ